eukprot:CAMPEP_0196747300 /NCGR_PEP_ID=MMETSP1091-20130531/69125_1 /TAXON_ID=302021 /ORGANISM="Rhodomonas sp., Strain CCMP768" /LENGTH=30 /DNA_ID= /DNA_START= /DNA_END= /DNA_ORIENTATION=
MSVLNDTSCCSDPTPTPAADADILKSSRAG